MFFHELLQSCGWLSHWFHSECLWGGYLPTFFQFVTSPQYLLLLFTFFLPTDVGMMVSQAAFSDNKGVIVGSQTGAVLCGHKQMALVRFLQQGGELLFVLLRLWEEIAWKDGFLDFLFVCYAASSCFSNAASACYPAWGLFWSLQCLVQDVTDLLLAEGVPKDKILLNFWDICGKELKRTSWGSLCVLWIWLLLFYFEFNCCTCIPVMTLLVIRSMLSLATLHCSLPYDNEARWSGVDSFCAVCERMWILGIDQLRGL